MNSCVAFYSFVSVVFVSACVAYSLKVIYKITYNSRIVVFCLLCFMLQPYNALYSITMWKDIFFLAVF